MDLDSPESLLEAMINLRQTIYEEGQSLFARWQPHIHRSLFTNSALNLAYYVALRRQDLRSLQVALMPWGISSLGRIEARVMQNLDAVIATLAAVCQSTPAYIPERPALQSFFEGDTLLQRNTEAVFGRRSGKQRVRIMVTLPSDAATDYRLVHNLIQRGADCVRINCAHDAAEAWDAMIHHVRQAELATKRACKILMDLAGAKPRLLTIVSPDPKRRIFKGDCILLCRKMPEHPAKSMYFQAECSLPEVFDTLKPGAPVWIDDGKIGAQVESITPDGVLLRITYARPKGEKVGPDKGLNFPESKLTLAPLTDKDIQDLDFVAAHADIVGYSFVQKTSDVDLLQKELDNHAGERFRRIAIVAKVETAAAVKNLPELIVHAAGKQPFGVMIARGDLAVEIGYQRLAEIQEEILWLCEAAHVPVIWATQVLETLVKQGVPSRAEITDAAMAERAECVMLNKGPFLADAVTILDDVLMRMQAHQVKKTHQLRALRSW
jgi:pyruvate kinase